MLTFFITANDTESGKTYVLGQLARHFAQRGQRVQVVKALDCGGSGDAAAAESFANSPLVSAHTLRHLPAPMAPMASPNQSTGDALALSDLIQLVQALPDTDIRLIEGAGGLAVPIDADGKDWRDFADALPVDGIVAVVENRLGTINQARLLHSYLDGRTAGFVLNTQSSIDPKLHASHCQALQASQIPIFGIVPGPDQALSIRMPQFLEPAAPISQQAPSSQSIDLRERLQLRRRNHAFRELSVRTAQSSMLNLADNDYLSLSRHPEVIAASRTATARWGTSASASPLISGYTELHAELEHTIRDWYQGRPALIWNSGYSANQSMLSRFIQRDHLVLADRLIHNSLIQGILRSGARLIRFRHNDLSHLESLLQKYAPQRPIHVVMESVYSMDGDAPDLAQVAQLKTQYDFQWWLDEAHAVGWYSPSGAGLAEAANVIPSVDFLTGTLGKALGACGAYTVFREAWMRDLCINEADEFIYSTYLPPSNAAAALAAIRIVQTSGDERRRAHNAVRAFRDALRDKGWEVPDDDSPIVSLVCGDSQSAIALCEDLKRNGIRAAAIRPPTVPEGSARIRLSLKATLETSDYQRLLDALTQEVVAHV